MKDAAAPAPFRLATTPRSPVRERLVATLVLTALLHAIVILGVTFGSGDGRTAPGMEVVLVTDDLPESRRNDRAHYLAQRTQQGAGNTRAGPTSAAAAGSPTPAGEPVPDTSTAEGTTTLITSGPSMIVRWLGESRSSSDAAAHDATHGDRSPGRPGVPGRDELTLIGDPKTGQWLAPDTRASVLAPYLESWRRKVERLGTLNYPTVARDRSLTGSPVIEVAIRSNGQLAESKVQRSSGHPQLDAAALDILRLASPFNPFPPELANRYRILRFAYQWDFEGGRAGAGTVTSATDARSGP